MSPLVSCALSAGVPSTRTHNRVKYSLQRDGIKVRVCIISSKGVAIHQQRRTLALSPHLGKDRALFLKSPETPPSKAQRILRTPRKHRPKRNLNKLRNPHPGRYHSALLTRPLTLASASFRKGSPNPHQWGFIEFPPPRFPFSQGIPLCGFYSRECSLVVLSRGDRPHAPPPQ
jgi:hypothetical protein